MKPADLTLRGLRTRAYLLQAAQRVFSERGFSGTRIADITDEASVAVGTFYTYFETKEQIFVEVVDQVEGALWDSLATERVRRTPVLSIRTTNERFLEMFRQHARFFAAVEEAELVLPQSTPSMKRLRIRNRDRIAAAIRSWRDAGLVRADVDPDLTALALGAMSERCAHYWFIFGEPVEFDRAVDLLSDMWVHALGLTPTEE